jgi:hypothetical protein
MSKSKDELKKELAALTKEQRGMLKEIFDDEDGGNSDLRDTVVKLQQDIAELKLKISDNPVNKNDKKSLLEKMFGE